MPRFLNFLREICAQIYEIGFVYGTLSIGATAHTSYGQLSHIKRICYCENTLTRAQGENVVIQDPLIKRLLRDWFHG